MSNHEEKFEELMQAYNFVLGVTQWGTSDLVKLAQLIDVELQTRAEIDAAEGEQQTYTQEHY